MNSISNTAEKWYPCNTGKHGLPEFQGRTASTGVVKLRALGTSGDMAGQANRLVCEQSAQKITPPLRLMKFLSADNQHEIEPDQMSDAEVIRRILDGDTNFFEHLLNRYKNRVFGIVGRHVPPDEIEEVAHDVFIRAFKSLAGYRHESGFKHWLSSIAVRTCHDFWRSRYRSREVAISGLSQQHQKWLEHTIAEESTLSFSDEINRKEASEILKWALKQLPEKDKTVLELIYFQDHSIKEASKLLGWTQTAVKVRSFRSRKKLQKILNDAMEPNSEGL